MLESKFKGLSDVALTEAKRLGCTYADIRFTRNTNSGVNASGGNRDAAEAAFGGFGGGRRWRPRRWWRRGGGGGGGGGAFGGGNAGEGAGSQEAAGFGVRVIHSGVWGFASSPIVTEDEIRRITRMASEVAKASAIAKKVDVRLAPVPAYTDYWVTPMEKDPAKVPQTEKQALVQKVVDLAAANKEVLTVNASISARSTNGSTSPRPKAPTSSRRSTRRRRTSPSRRARTARRARARSPACRAPAAGRSPKRPAWSKPPSASPPKRSSSAPPSRSRWG